MLGAVLMSSRAPVGAAALTVTSNPLWTDTGITLAPQDGVGVHGASGSWTWSVDLAAPSGPDGDYQPDFVWDEWIQNAQHGQLIGFLGNDPYPASQNDPRLFSIGTSVFAACGLSGHLWLGFNDDWTRGPGFVDDNLGSVTVQVDVYAIRSLFDPSRAVNAGSTLPVKIQVFDLSGDNVSSPSLTVHATHLVQLASNAGLPVVDAGNANPDSNFRYDAAVEYIFNLKTTGLSAGGYRLFFTVGGFALGCVDFRVR
jgi:hypothetical protein